MKIISVYIDEEMYNLLKSKTNNISKHIVKLITQEMETEEGKIKRLNEEIKSKREEIEDIEKNKMKEIKIKEEKIKNLSNEQKEELILSSNMLKKHGELFEGRYNRYKNFFGFISKEDFKELLNLSETNK